MDKVAIGVDLGGTNLRFGAVTENGEVLACKKTLTRSDAGPERVMARIVRGIRALADKVSGDGRTVAGAGIGVPGIISVKEGVVRFSPNLPGWVDVPLKATLKAGLGMPVVVENDANAYALGEAWMGAGKGAKSLVCITLGTGVGGGIILGGKIWRGEDGMAGEVGHMTVEPGGIKCHCGNRGCLEQYASATAVVKLTEKALLKGRVSTLKNLFDRTPGSLTSDSVYEAAVAGDKLAKDVFRDAGKYLGIAIADLINLLNIERVVIGGGMAGAWPDFIDRLTEEVGHRAFKIPAARCKVLPGTLGDDAGILGAASLVFKGRRA